MTVDIRPALPLYEQSSQFKYWRFSKQSLQDLRQELNRQAVARVKGKVEEEQQEVNSLQDAPPSIEYLSVQDEISLVTFYLTKVPQLAKAFGFSDVVANTAMTYLKRFYLNNTCMDYHPKNVMLTCLFLATKTENQVISISSFVTKIKQASPSDVLSLEFLVSQSLRFQYKVHHASLAGYGIFLDLQTGSDENLTEVELMYNKASAFIEKVRLSDMEFLYSPSQIALASFYLVDPAIASTWLFSKQPTLTQMDSEALLQLIKTIAAEVKTFSEIDIKLDLVREVDKRLRYCRNPDKDPNSAIFKKRAAEEAAADNERRAQKAKTEALEDPFAVDGQSVMVPESARIEIAQEQNAMGFSALKPHATPPEIPS